MSILAVLIAVVFCALSVQGVTVHSTLNTCNNQCTGPWDSGCSGSDNSWVCKCSGGYYEEKDKALCEDHCDDLYWSWFTTGDCAKVSKTGSCKLTCEFRIRWWTHGFIIVLFVAAVLTIFFMLPLCISSCSACLNVKKEQKERKKGAGQVGPGGGNENYVAASYEGAGTMVPAKSAGGAPGMGYNPYMYYNPYLYSR